MAYVAITSMTLIFKGRSGTFYNIPITKAAAVGYCTFTQDSQTFWRVPEDVVLVDANISDTPNAADYLDVYVNSVVKPQARLMLKPISTATTIPRITPLPPIKAGSQLALYHYSA